MGRQAYITRLTLGRSPFEAPELSETGEFILGPEAHEFDNSDGYVQQFNERGHPENRASRATARELRRAKNDVLSTVGVVVNKENLKSAEGRKNDKQKIEAIILENQYGLMLGGLTGLFKDVAEMSLIALRWRFQTFRSFSSIPLMEVVRSEIRILGPLAFLTAGLPAQFALLTGRRLLKLSLDFIAIAGYRRLGRGGRIYARVLFRLLEVIIDVVTMPIDIFVDLQMLHLITPEARPSLKALIPFSEYSPFQLPSLPRTFSYESIVPLLFDTLKSPLFISLSWGCMPAFDLRAKIRRILYRVIITPNAADELSRIAAKEGEDEVAVFGDYSAGLYKTDHPTLWAEIKREFDFVSSWLKKLRKWTKERQLESSNRSLRNDIALRIRCIELQREALLAAETSNPGTQLTGAMRLNIQTAAVRRAFEEHGISDTDDIREYISPWNPQQADNEWATSDPEEIFAMEDLGPSNQNGQSTTDNVNYNASDRSNIATSPPPGPSESYSSSREGQQGSVRTPPVEPLSRANTLFSPLNRSPATTPPTSPRVRASLIHQDSQTVTMQLDFLGSHERRSSPDRPPHNSRTERNESRTGANNRRRSRPRDLTPSNAENTQNHVEGVRNREDPQTEGTPVYNLDDILGEDGATANVFNPLEGLPIQPLARARTLEDDDDFPRDRDSDTHLQRQEFEIKSSGTHRVTLLANHSSDAMTSYASSLIATAIFLPLQSLYLRAIVRAFLSNPASRPGAAAAALGIKADVRGFGLLGGEGGLTERLKYASTMILILGLQGVLSTAFWGIGTGVATMMGRRFGWGRL